MAEGAREPAAKPVALGYAGIGRACLALAAIRPRDAVTLHLASR